MKMRKKTNQKKGTKVFQNLDKIFNYKHPECLTKWQRFKVTFIGNFLTVLAMPFIIFYVLKVFFEIKNGKRKH
jgi:hypothetical protein